MCATRRANNTMAVSTPIATPMARLWLSRVENTVTSMTVVSLSGIFRSVEGFTECQLKEPTATMIMMPVSAAMGISPTMSPKLTTSTSKNTPASSVDKRVRAPEARVLISVWPIIAHPPMPPNTPVTMFAIPWPQLSRVLSEWTSVMSSTNFAVSRDSSNPTKAMPSAYGAMISNVSSVKGTLGKISEGRLEGSSP